MSLFISNQTGGTLSINDMGITLVLGESYNLAQDRAVDVAISLDLPANITAGNIAVLDPLDGVTPLSPTAGVEAVAAMNDTHYRIRGGSLNQLDDVDTAGLVDGQGLQYNSTSGNFEVITPAGAQNVFETVAGDTGSTTAASPTDTLTINGTTDQVTTAMVGSVLTAALAPNTIIPGTEGIQIPSGVTDDRPVIPVIGDMRFNTTDSQYEAWDGTQWIVFGVPAGTSIKELTGGVLTHEIGTSIIPYDDTIPQKTEGTDFFQHTITTETAGARIILWFSTIVSVGNANRIATITVWRDTTLIGVTAIQMPSTNAPVTTTFIVVDAPGAGTFTYEARIGVSAAATWRVGGYTANANYGDAGTGDVTNNQYVLMRVE